MPAPGVDATSAACLTLMEALPHGVVLADVRGRVVAANAATSRILSMPRETLLSIGLPDPRWQVVTPDGSVVPPGEFPLSLALRTRSAVPARVVGVLRDGGPALWLEVAASPLPDGGAVLTFQDVSEQRRTEARAQSMLRTALDGVWLVDADNRIVEVNEAACRMLRLTREELVGHPVSEVEAAESPDETFRHRDRVCRAGADLFETVHRRKDGSVFPVEISVTYLPDCNQMVTFVRDISGRHEAEASLRRSESRLRAIFDTEPECVKLVSPEGLLVDMNAAGLAMLEVERAEDAIGKPVIRMVVPEHRAAFEEIGRRVFAGEAAQGEFVIVGLRGTRRWMETHAAPLRDEEGRITAMLAVTRDITARKQAEAALKESEAHFHGLVMASPTPIGVSDADGRIEILNHAFVRTFGWDRDDLPDLATWWVRAYPDPAYREWARGQWAEATERMEREGVEARLAPLVDVTCKDGTVRTVEVQGTRLGHRIIVALNDLTERRRAEEERARMERQVHHTQRMESLGSLAGGVAHDMNNVLAAILALATVHQEAGVRDPEMAGDMETIVKACLRGKTLVQGLLRFARPDLAQDRVLDLNDVVREEVALLERTTLQRVRIVESLDPGLHPVRGDPAALSHALMNLCVNAVGAMPQGGLLTLATRNDGPGHVLLEVTDTGCGMTREVLDKAFDPFFTTKPPGKGTGLGLAIVYGTVKAHGGQVELRSTPGTGTTALLRFPACAAEDAAAAVSPVVAPRAAALEVLVVEDDDLVQVSVRRVLAMLGHHPVITGSGEQALEELERGRQADVVLLDLNMPGLGGAAALPRIRALRPGLPVLLATGRVDEAALELVRRHQGVRLLTKPFTPAELEAELAALCRPGAAAS